MAFPVTLNGRTYTLTDFEGTNYVDGLPDAFEDFVTHAGDIYNSTSTTSNSIGTGSKTFTVEANKPYQAGTPLRIADAAAPSTNFLDTVVTSYSGTTLVVNSIGYGGSGTKTSWTVNIGGAKTVDGTLGLSQGGTGATTAAAARTNIDVYSKSEADTRYLNVSGDSADVSFSGTLTAAKLVSSNGVLELDDDGSHNGVINSPASMRINIDSDNGATGEYFAVGHNQTSINTSNILFKVQDDGKVGIGESDPDSNLQISNASSVPSFSLGRTPYSSHGSLTIGGTQVGAIMSNTDEAGNSTASVNALKILVGNGDLTFGHSPNTAVGSARTFTDRFTLDTFGGFTIKAAASGAATAAFGGTNVVNGITAVPSTAGTPFVVGRDTGSTRSAHFGGNLKFDSGYGIDFSATSGTGTSELLDDYEEGTWTPAVGGTTTDPTVTYTTQAGFYVKIGRMVHISMYLNCTAVSGGSGAVKISGVPFSANNAGSYFGGSQMEIFGLNVPSNMNNVVLRVNGNSGAFRLEFINTQASSTGGAGAGVATGDLANNFRVLGSFTYMTS